MGSSIIVYARRLSRQPAYTEIRIKGCMYISSWQGRQVSTRPCSRKPHLRCSSCLPANLRAKPLLARHDALFIHFASNLAG